MNYSPKLDQDEQASRIAYLVAGYIRKTLPKKEHDELDRWVESSDENMRLFEELTDENNLAANLAWMDSLQVERKLQDAKKGLTFHNADPVKQKRFAGTYIAIAAILISVVTGIYIFERSEDAAPSQSITEIIPPANKVILMLEDGRVIDLIRQETLRSDYGGSVTHDSTLIEYKDVTEGQRVYHTITTAAGSTYEISLSDGTKVWLNAGSSLRYPVSFNNTDRTVELNGEGYFEVAKNASKPFTVKMGDDGAVKVLGTKFNVQDYKDEAVNEVSLVEGSIEVSAQNKKQLLRPGEQLVLNTLQLNKAFDEEAVLGWKNDRFVFHDADIKTIMQQVKRWYDIDVRLSHIPREKFNATISRKEPLSKLLRLLELTGKVHFKTENKIVYVLQ